MAKTTLDGFQKTAFDHPLVHASGSLANASDRVLVPPACRCPRCVERLARYPREGFVMTPRK